MIKWVPLIILAIALWNGKHFGHILHRLWYLVSLTNWELHIMITSYS